MQPELPFWDHDQLDPEVHQQGAGEAEAVRSLLDQLLDGSSLDTQSKAYKDHGHEGLAPESVVVGVRATASSRSTWRAATRSSRPSAPSQNEWPLAAPPHRGQML
jgi:hypothetical protein